MTLFWQLVLNGLMLGGLFAIVSIGLTLIFGIVRVVNFAHGEFLMIGMYAVYLAATSLGLHPYFTAPPLIVVFFILGLLVQRFIIQPLLSAEDSHIQIFATVGLSTALINLALLVFGADIHATPPFNLRTTLEFGPFRLLFGQVVMFVCGILLVVGLHLFLTYTYVGRGIRATAQNRDAARLMGVNVDWINMITFGIGLGCVALAAVLIAPMYPVSPTSGVYFILIAFVVVVLGGMGSLYGAFLGAVIIGLVDSLSSYYISPGLKEVAAYLLFLAILIFRPTGLFGAGRGSE